MRVSPTLIVISVVTLGAVATLCYVSYRVHHDRSAVILRPLLRERVTFQPGGQPSDIAVWNRTKWSTSLWDSQDIFQTNIEIRESTGTHAFAWPNDAACAADGAQLMDLDGDDRKEIVLSCRIPKNTLRVVQFNGTALIFRPGKDELPESLTPSESIDSGCKEAVAFTVLLPYPDAFGHRQEQGGLALPVAYTWRKNIGFKEISGNCSNFYFQHVIPELKRNRDQETDAARKELFSQAIAYVEERMRSTNNLLEPPH